MILTFEIAVIAAAIIVAGRDLLRRRAVGDGVGVAMLAGLVIVFAVGIVMLFRSR